MPERQPKPESKAESLPKTRTEESGVRSRPSQDAHAEDKERSKRLIIGTTKQIIKLLEEERDLLLRIGFAQFALDRLEAEQKELNPSGLLGIVERFSNRSQIEANKNEIESVKKSLATLENEYLDTYVRVGRKKTAEFGADRSWEEREDRVMEKIAKQKAILEREERAYASINQAAR